MIEMMAYLAWILLLTGGMGVLFRRLNMDRPRKVRIAVRREEKRLRKEAAGWH
jgi:hypothetical protein